MVELGNEESAHESQLSRVQTELVQRVRAGGRAVVEQLRAEFPEVFRDFETALELIYTEFVARCECQQHPDRGELYRRFPEFQSRLKRLFGLYDFMNEADTLPNPTTTLPVRGPGTNGVDGAGHPAGYALLEEIGRGGSAIVYRARQQSLNRIVAIKMLRTTAWTHEHDGQSLQREAELAAKLQHPNIVQIFEIGEWNDVPYLSMEFVPGGGLNTKLAEHLRRGTWLSSGESAELVETLARAIHFAHERGVVHRDIKPANVLIQEKETGAAPGLENELGGSPIPKVVDFGLALALDAGQSIRQTTTVLGTPCYMAPEQAEGRKGDIGPATDVYALGAILYELLTARPPFQGATILETLERVRLDDPVAPRVIQPRTPKDLETICLKCLRKAPSQRFTTALELADDLQHYRRGEPIVARPVSAVEHGIKWVKRHPAVAGLSVALCGAIAVGAVVQAEKIRESELARQKEQQLHREVEAGLAGKLVASARALWGSGQLDEARQLLKDCPATLRDAEWKTLHNLCHAEIASWSGVEFVGDTLAVSPDGERLAMHCKGSARRIQVINAKDGQPIGSIETTAALHQIAFTSNGQTLIIVRPASAVAKPKAGTESNLLDAFQFGTSGNVSDKAAEVVIWKVARNEPKHRWSTSDSVAVAISGDGKRIAGRDGARLRVWDSLTGQSIRELPAPVDRRARYSLAMDGQGKVLAVRFATEIQIWDVETGQLAKVVSVEAFDLSKWEKLMPVLKNFPDPVFLRPDGRIVVANLAKPIAATKEGLPTVRSLVAWNIANGREEFQFATKGLSPRLSFSPDGKLMAIVGIQNVELHSAYTGDYRATLRGHSANIHIVRFSPDGRRLFSMAGDTTLRTWDISPWAD